MKKINKKGFTLVELVIVIAVIAILAGVLIPTFSSVINSAKENAVLQAAKNHYTEVTAEDVTDGIIDQKKGNSNITMPTGCSYITTNGTISGFSYTDETYTATLTLATGVWAVTKN